MRTKNAKIIKKTVFCRKKTEKTLDKHQGGGGYNKLTDII